MISIKPVSAACLLECKTLIEEYAAECSIPEIGPIDPQPDLYDRLEKSGALTCFGAYRGHDLIGFGNILIYALPHYSKKVATIESIFISINQRKSHAGLSLMNAIEEYARTAGCEGILYSAPVGGGLERLLAASKPYTRTNSIFYRGLFESSHAS